MNRRQELKYFNIGRSYGGNQRWMMDPWMHVGGCAALTTCDAFIYFALHKGKTELCPYQADSLTKKQYRKFCMSMKPYLQPRETGIKDIDTYMNGVRLYLEDIGFDGFALSGIRGAEPYERAESVVISQLDKGVPVPYLMLKHQDKKFDFFEWHWFLVTGYDIREEGVYVKAATYGKAHWLPFAGLWNTGYEEKGGMVVIDVLK